MKVVDLEEKISEMKYMEERLQECLKGGILDIYKNLYKNNLI